MYEKTIKQNEDFIITIYDNQYIKPYVLLKPIGGNFEVTIVIKSNTYKVTANSLVELYSKLNDLDCTYNTIILGDSIKCWLINGDYQIKTNNVQLTDSYSLSNSDIEYTLILTNEEETISSVKNVIDGKVEFNIKDLFKDLRLEKPTTYNLTIYNKNNAIKYGFKTITIIPTSKCTTNDRVNLGSSIAYSTDKAEAKNITLFNSYMRVVSTVTGNYLYTQRGSKYDFRVELKIPDNVAYIKIDNKLYNYDPKLNNTFKQYFIDSEGNNNIVYFFDVENTTKIESNVYGENESRVSYNNIIEKTNQYSISITKADLGVYKCYAESIYKDNVFDCTITESNTIDLYEIKLS